MWLDIRIRLCGWTKSLRSSRVGVCVLLSIRSLDLVVLGLPVLKRRSLGRGDPKLSLLRLWGQSSCLFNSYRHTWLWCLRNTKFCFISTQLSLRLKTLRVLCPFTCSFYGCSFIHIGRYLMDPVLLIGRYPYSHWVLGAHPGGIESYRSLPQ